MDSWRAMMKEHQAESARKHEESARRHEESIRRYEEMIDLLKKYAIPIGRAKVVEEWEKWRGLKRAEEAYEDTISNLKSQIFVEACDDGSRSDKNFACSGDKIAEFPIQPATTNISEKDGSSLEEFPYVLTGDEGKENLGHKLIDDLDKPHMVIESNKVINKNDFAVVAPVGAEHE